MWGKFFHGLLLNMRFVLIFSSVITRMHGCYKFTAENQGTGVAGSQAKIVRSRRAYCKDKENLNVLQH